MGERRGALDQLLVGHAGRVRVASPAPEYRQVGQRMGNDETSDPNGPERTPR
jgi:hypothetical protein